MNIAPGRSGNKLTGGLSAHPSAAACGARWEGNKRTEPTGMTTDNRRIYVDLDDVLCETAEAARDIARRRFGRSVDFSHIHSFDLGTSFGLSTVEADGLMGELNDPSVLADLAPRAGAPECLRAWSDAGYAVFVVTGRPPLVQPATKQWLAARRVPYDELLFTDKYGRYRAGDTHPEATTVELSELGRMGFVFAVEDSADTTRFLSTELRIPVLLLDRPWNAGYPWADGKVRRCRDWEELAEVVASGFPA